MGLPKPANDLSPWEGWRFTRICECGCQLFYIALLDDAPVAYCSRCEKDHTEALYTNWKPRG